MELRGSRVDGLTQAESLLLVRLVRWQSRGQWLRPCRTSGWGTCRRRRGRRGSSQSQSTWASCTITHHALSPTMHCTCDGAHLNGMQQQGAEHPPPAEGLYGAWTACISIIILLESRDRPEDVPMRGRGLSWRRRTQRPAKVKGLDDWKGHTSR